MHQFTVDCAVGVEKESQVVALGADPALNTSNSGLAGKELKEEGARFARFVFENFGGLQFAAGFHQEFERLVKEHAGG